MKQRWGIIGSNQSKIIEQEMQFCKNRGAFLLGVIPG